MAASGHHFSSFVQRRGCEIPPLNKGCSAFVWIRLCTLKNRPCDVVVSVLFRQPPDVLGELGWVCVPLVSHAGLVDHVSCLELVSRQTDVHFCGISCCYRCFISTMLALVVRHLPFKGHSAFTWQLHVRQVLLFRFEQGGVVVLDVRCHVLSAAVAYLDGVRVEDSVQDWSFGKMFCDEPQKLLPNVCCDILTEPGGVNQMTFRARFLLFRLPELAGLLAVNCRVCACPLARRASW